MADMHTMYGLSNVNARLAAILYAERFPNRHLPDHSVFSRLHQPQRDSGSFEVMEREAGGRRSSAS